MTIRDIDNYISSLWDFGSFNGCFGDTRITLSDLDGITERRGKFLVFEGKSKNVPIPKGQEILFRSMVDTGKFTVVIAWGEPNNPTKLQVMTHKGVIIIEPADMDKLRNVVSRWFIWANNSTN
jgi:hypothetical protein